MLRWRVGWVMYLLRRHLSSVVGVGSSQQLESALIDQVLGIISRSSKLPEPMPHGLVLAVLLLLLRHVRGQVLDLKHVSVELVEIMVNGYCIFGWGLRPWASYQVLDQAER
ncbi:unnamed protein product [Musa hybrid cultivar]